MAERLTDRQVDEAVADLDGGWSIDGGRLRSETGYPDFEAALSALNAVAALAEDVGHHPDLELHDWNKLTITIYTHSVEGLTTADFDLAKAINKLD